MPKIKKAHFPINLKKNNYRGLIILGLDSLHSSNYDLEYHLKTQLDSQLSTTFVGCFTTFTWDCDCWSKLQTIQIAEAAESLIATSGFPW